MESPKINWRVHSVLTYALKFAAFSKNMVRKLENNISKVIKAKLKVARSTDDNIVYGAIKGAGLGIQSVWDRVNITKLKMLVAGLNSSESFYYEAMVQRVSTWHGGEGSFWQAECPSNFKGWVHPLWK